MSKLEPLCEIFEPISVEALVLQYSRLVSWMDCIARESGWHEFFTLQSLVLRRKSDKNSASTFEVSVKDLRDASRWPRRYAPVVGAVVYSYKRGVCVIAINKKTDMTQFY